MRLTVEWYIKTAEAKRLLKPAEERFHRQGGAIVRLKMRALFKRKGEARRAPKRKYKADGTTWTAAYRKWRDEITQRRPSTPPAPPHTWTGLLRTSIIYQFDPSKLATVVGPAHSIVGIVGELHDLGGTRYGRKYPPRPFRGPAMEKSKEQLAKLWQDAIKPN